MRRLRARLEDSVEDAYHRIVWWSPLIALIALVLLMLGGAIGPLR